MFKSLQEIEERVENEGLSYFEVVLEDDSKEQGLTKEKSFARMLGMYQAMKEADEAYDETLSSRSGLVGKDGGKVRKAREEGRLLCGEFIGMVMEKAIKMGESNACMKRIVAAPTAGSCGVIPAVFLTLQKEKKYTDEEMTRALYVSAGIGGVIASRAFIAGAAGGCQAEIGTASAMAAGAVAYLMGADASVISHAAALSLKNLLGLVCDPVAGLVEVPCVKRNVLGAVNALTSADLALCGIVSRIPPDEVIDAMRAVGKAMPEAFRETGMGGLAATPTAERIKKEL